MDFIQKKHWGYLGGGEGRGGVWLEAVFFTAEISPNGNPKINLLTLSKGFFMNFFNNLAEK